MRSIRVIDFLKGYSIFTIIMYHLLQELHLPSPFNKLLLFGGAGVHLFIFLSGLGMYLSHLNKPMSYVGYLKKRVAKVYIPYALTIVIISLFSIFLPIYKNSMYAIGGHIFLYKMFDESIVCSYGYQLWFISMILQFYIVFYLLIILLEKMKVKYFIITCFTISAIWIALVLLLGHESKRIWNSFFLQYLWEFALGMAAASKIFKSNYEINFKLNSIYFLLIGISSCLLYGLLAIKGGNIGKMVNDVPSLIGYSSIAIWIYKLNLYKLNNFLTFTGSISFSLYLSHIFILLTVLFFLKNMQPIAIVFITLIATYIISIYYQKIIDSIYTIIKI